MLRDSELARREGGRVELRSGGIRLQWELAELATADGHRIYPRFRCMVGALPDPIEQKTLEQTLLSSRSVLTATEVIEHFSPSLVAATAPMANLPADEILSDTGRERFRAALADAAKAAAFACGLEIQQPITLDLDCPTLRKEQASRRQAAEQGEQLVRAAEIFARFQAIRISTPDLPAGQILQRIGAADQAELLRAIVQSHASQSVVRRLLAVAGSSLIEIDLRTTSPKPLIPLPDDLGPLRSVRGDAENRLFLGARAGILALDAQTLNSTGLFRAGSINSQLGFNAAVALGNRIWATHSEAGLFRWDLDRPETPKQFTDVRSARNLAKLNDRLIFSSGRQLMMVDPDESVQPIGSPASADVVGIFLEKDRAIIVQEDGIVRQFNPRDWNEVQQHRRSGRVVAAAILPWLGEARLLLAEESGKILCVSVEDEIVTQYSSAHLSPRIVAGSETCVAAVTADRQRVVLWHSWDGRQPLAEANLATVAKHRIADLIFI